MVAKLLSCLRFVHRVIVPILALVVICMAQRHGDAGTGTTGGSGGGPSAPTNLTATGGLRQASLLWDGSSGATSYNVLRSLSGNSGTFSAAGSSTATSYTDTGLADGATYYYEVTASNSKGTSGPSNIASALTIPAVPLGLTVQGAWESCSLTWGACQGASSYNVERSTASGGPYSSVGTATSASFTDSGLADGTSYYYEVQSTNATGSSALCPWASGLTLPAAPTDLTGTLSNGTVNLTWDSVLSATSYVVSLRAVPPNLFWEFIGWPTTTSFSDQPGLGNFLYDVSAENATGPGPAAQIDMAVTLAAPQLTATAGNGCVLLSWTASTSAVAYTLGKSSQPSGPYSTIYSGANQTFTDVNVMNGGTYYYQVFATASDGTQSPGSNVASATPTATSTTNPTPIQVAQNGTLGYTNSPLALVPWMEATLPTDTSPAPGVSASSGFVVDLPYGGLEFASVPDIDAMNPTGPGIAFQRLYRTPLANAGINSPGLAPGWVDNFDIKVVPAPDGIGQLLLYPNGSSDYLTVVGSSLTPPEGAPYTVTGTQGQNGWSTVTVSFGGDAYEQFTALPNDTAGTLRLTQIQSNTDRQINFLYNSSDLLSSVTNDSNLTLLTFSYIGGYLRSIADDNSRSVYFSYNPDQQGQDQLTNASIPGSSAYLWTYGYTPITTAQGSTVSYLNSATTFDGTGTFGAAVASVYYDQVTGNVYEMSDADGNVRGYVYNGGSTQVKVLGAGKSYSESDISNATNSVDTWTITFDGYGRGTQFQNMAGDVTSLTYWNGDPADIASVTTPGDTADKPGDTNATTATYDNFGNPQQITSAFGNNLYEKFGYDYTNPLFPHGLLTSVQEGSKSPCDITYFPSTNATSGKFAGLVSALAIPDPGSASGSGIHSTFSYTYTSMGDVLTVSGPSGDIDPVSGVDLAATVTYNYGSSEVFGEPLTITDPDGQPSELTWDSFGELLSSTDPMGNVTQAGYDSSYPGSGDLYSVNFTGKDNPSTTVSSTITNDSFYSPVNDTETFINGNHKFLESKPYYGPDWQFEATGGDSTMPTGVTYDPNYLVSSINNNWNTTLFQYFRSPAQRQFKEEMGDGIWTYNYAPSGRLLSVVDPNQANATVTSAEKPDSEAVLGQPSSDDRPSGVGFTDQNGNSLGAGVQYQYDSYGRVSQVSDDGVATFKYTYDDLDDVTSVQETGGSGAPSATIYYFYYPNGQRQYMVVAPPSATTYLCYSYTYDLAGQLQTVTAGQLSASDFQAKDYGALSGMTGATISYYYDADGRITEAISGSVDTVYVYNAIGELLSLTNKTTATTPNTGNLISEFGDPGYGANIGYGWDGNIASMPFELTNGLGPTGQTLASGTVTYGPGSGDGQLPWEDWQWSVPTTNAQDITITPDGGNLDALRSNSYTNDVPNSRIKFDGTNGFSYDADGNLLTGDNYNLSWEVRGGISSISGPLAQGQASPSYTYTSDGWRSGKQGGTDANGVAQNYNFLYDGDQLVGEFDPSTNSFVHAYLWGANGLSMRINDPCGTPTVMGYAFDPSGNTVGRCPVGAANPVQSAQLFDAFGEITYEAESTALSDPIAYKGQWGCYSDPELPQPYQLVYCHYRYYSPYLGRWLSRDPSGADGGINCYEFCGNSPVLFSDPSGLRMIAIPKENWPAGSYISWSDQFTDFWAGYGDTLSFGLTKWGRRGLGALLNIGDPNDVVDYDSGGYLGGEIAGTLHSILTGGAQGWAKAGEKTSGLVFSHWIPTRFLEKAAAIVGKDSKLAKWLVDGFGVSKWNGNYVSQAEHYFSDFHATVKGWTRMDPGKWNPIVQQAFRVPRVYYGGAGGYIWSRLHGNG